MCLSLSALFLHFYILHLAFGLLTYFLQNMRVLLLDNYDSFTYNLAQLLEQSGLCTYDVILNDQVEVETISDYDKILISPGPGLPHESGRLQEIVHRYAAVKPILGICLGLQAIAIEFGWRLVKMEEAQHGQTVETTILNGSEPLFAGLPPAFRTTLYHSWMVDPQNPGDDLVITARSRRGNIMAMRHKTYDVCGLQFHPESAGTEYGREMIENWLIRT